MVQMRLPSLIVGVAISGLWVTLFCFPFMLLFLSIPFSQEVYDITLGLSATAVISTLFWIGVVVYAHENPGKSFISRVPQSEGSSGLLTIAGIVVLASGSLVLFGPFLVLLEMITFWLWSWVSSSNATKTLHQVITRHQNDQVIPLETFATETSLNTPSIQLQLLTMIEHKEVAGRLDAEGYHP